MHTWVGEVGGFCGVFGLVLILVKPRTKKGTWSSDGSCQTRMVILFARTALDGVCDRIACIYRCRLPPSPAKVGGAQDLSPKLGTKPPANAREEPRGLQKWACAPRWSAMTASSETRRSVRKRQGV
ncbi:hypothetical protein P171DRAFT_6606 [Karstenula rhodostoma CBS 690.94]|uniref:Uncharacterized protein n=1 Tax=Karstenula rhodostoma CBS 690.94 TaxID=1392251 RepID=A0A9P4PWF5_9PLEO|nr:hypothetical protein P171DRAFT_6606 [Karstenula rhodostoma CBS 690.94]